MLNFTPFPEPYSPPMDKDSVRIREIDAEIHFIRSDMEKLQAQIGSLQLQRAAVEKQRKHKGER